MAHDEREVEFGTLADQGDETGFDSRLDAGNDLEKGRIQFPPPDRLYGRDHELQQLRNIYHSFPPPPTHADNGNECRSSGHIYSAQGERTSSSSSINNSHPLRDPDPAVAGLSLRNQSTKTSSEKCHAGSTSTISSSSNSFRSRIVFLAGYSGTGKSTLVDTFVREQQQQQQQLQSKQQRLLQPCLLYLSVKFGSPLTASGMPFSALRQALNQFVLQIVHQLEEKEEDEEEDHSNQTIRQSQLQLGERQFWIGRFMKALSKFDISSSSLESTVLEKTLIPSLPLLLQKAASKRTTAKATVGGATTSSASVAPAADGVTSSSTSSSSPCTTTQGNLSGKRGILLPEQSLSSNALDLRPTAGAAAAMNLTLIQYSLVQFLRALTTSATVRTVAPMRLVFFLDDLQWADEASLQILKTLCLDSTLPNIMFVLAYRPGEVNERHCFYKLVMQPIQEARESTGSGKDGDPTTATTCTESTNPLSSPLSPSSCVHFIELSNLSPETIAKFIADCVHQKPDQVSSLAEAVYQKTLGNIFFVKQALEELVRKNVLYYDNICFQWQVGDVSRVQLEQFLSEDVIDMVVAKLQALPSIVQTVLIMAAHTSETTIDLHLMQKLLQAADISITPETLEQHMQRAFIEGLVLHYHSKSAYGSAAVTPRSSCTTATRCYQFSHDRIREAACAMVPPGPKRDQLFLRIAKVLLQQAEAAGVTIGNDGARKGGTGATDLHLQNDNPDWMLFAAARHLNSLPDDVIENDNSSLDLPNLNLTVGRIAIAKGSFHEACLFLQEGLKRLNPHTCWKEPTYSICLELKVILAESEKMLGHNDKALELVEEIFHHATCLEHKSRVHHCYIEATNSKNGNNYSQSVDTALGILALYSIRVPFSPTKWQVAREKLLLRCALRSRSLACLSQFPITTEPLQFAPMKVASLMLLYAVFAKRETLAVLLGYRMLRIALRNKTITKDMPALLVSLGAQLRKNRNYESAFLLGNVVTSLMDRFPGYEGMEFFRANLGLQCTLYCLRVPFRDCVESSLDLNKRGYSLGETDIGFGAGMVAMYSFMIASLPLNAQFELKLLQLEEMSLSRGRKSYAIIFNLIRQYLYNLQGGDKACPIPSKVNGAAFNEEEALAMMDGIVRKQTMRDISMVRLELSVTYDDDEGMEEMLNRLDEFPVHDHLAVRQQLRLTYVGIAALLLIQKQMARGAIKSTFSIFSSTKHQKWAKLALKYFDELSRFGSPNAQPVYACMKALQKPSVTAFDEAIESCANAGLLNLGAIMNERCALMLLEQEGRNDTLMDDTVKGYFKCAMWMYHDWGATGKVAMLASRFECLKNAMQEKAPPNLSSIRRVSAMRTLSRSHGSASGTTD